jgi:hypothetical protein
MEFAPDEEYIPLEGRLIYRKNEYSFDFIAADWRFAGGGAPLVIGTLQIEIDIYEHHLLFPRGLHPYTTWLAGDLPLLSAKRCGVKALVEGVLQAGAGIEIAAVGEWKTVYDPRTRWICIHGNDAFYTHTDIEFAENVVAGLLEQKLVSLWLRPVNELDLLD